MGKGLLEEPAGRRGTGDIEPNALNKAGVMKLMTGCVSLACARCTSVTATSLHVSRLSFPLTYLINIASLALASLSPDNMYVPLEVSRGIGLDEV